MNAEETRELERLREENSRLRQIFNDGALLQYTQAIDPMALKHLPHADLDRITKDKTANAIGRMLVKSGAVHYTERSMPDYMGGRGKQITGAVMVVPLGAFHVFDMYLSHRSAPSLDADNYELEAFAIHLVNEDRHLRARLTETGQTYVRFQQLPRLGQFADMPSPESREMEIVANLVTCLVVQRKPGARPYAIVVDQNGNRTVKRANFKAERDKLDHEREIERRFGKKGPPIE